MARANIDLSWLASLLTKTPTATPNPTYGAEQEAPYTDPVTGQTSSAPAYTDAGGNEIPGSLPKGADITSRFTAPSKWQTFVHPEAAAAINSLNSGFASRPIIAQQTHDIGNTIGAQDAKLMRPLMPTALQSPSISDTQAYLATGGDYQPTHTGTEGRALLNNAANIQAPQSAADVAQANVNLSQATGELQREPVHESGLAQQDVNNLSRLLHVDAPTINLNAQQIKAQIGIEPTVEQVREYTINQQKQEAELGLKTSTERNTLYNTYGAPTMHNQAVKDLADSSNYPIQPPYENRINPSGTITPRTRNPLGMSTMAQTMGAMSDLTNANGLDTIKDNHGNTYTIPKAPPGDVDPLNPGGNSRSLVAPPDTSSSAPTNTNSVPVVPQERPLTYDMNPRNVSTSTELSPWIKWLLQQGQSNSQSFSPYGLH